MYPITHSVGRKRCQDRVFDIDTKISASDRPELSRCAAHPLNEIIDPLFYRVEDRGRGRVAIDLAFVTADEQVEDDRAGR